MKLLDITEIQRNQIILNPKFYDNFFYRCGYCKETIEFEELKLTKFRWARQISSALVNATGVEYTFCSQTCLELFCVLKGIHVE